MRNNGGARNVGFALFWTGLLFLAIWIWMLIEHLRSAPAEQRFDPPCVMILPVVPAFMIYAGGRMWLRREK
jgi:hypothetical protein